MSHPWKSFRTNLMYWRFRFITRNRFRLQAWWGKRRPSPAYRPRATSTKVYQRSGKKTWSALLVTVALLVGLRLMTREFQLNPSLAYALGAFVIVGATYWALKNA